MLKNIYNLKRYVDINEILKILYNTCRVAFTGDIFVNLKNLTKKQTEYNQYAPILMTSVDTDSELCAKERSAFLQRLGVGKWIFRWTRTKESILTTNGKINKKGLRHKA